MLETILIIAIALIAIRFAAHIITGVLSLITWLITAIIWVGFWLLSAGIMAIVVYIAFLVL